MNLASQISFLLNRVGHQEFLLGKCESDQALTSTQEHILMLLAEEENLTQVKIAELLNISPAAVTKAVKVLQKQAFVGSKKSKNDERVSILSLTAKGQPIALEHAAHHQKTLEVYSNMLNDFSESEQLVIEKFMQKLTEVIQ